ncbi:hypothetical protein BDW62DRAFT_192103, partial [Aspergillus aurantiobrunneus]
MTIMFTIIYILTDTKTAYTQCLEASLWTSALVSCDFSSFLSTTASFAALARVPRLASLSLATSLLASLDALAPVPWIDSL